MKGDAFMRILTNVSKAELAYLTNQPTAKAMIEKVKTEGIYIAEGDAERAAEFVEMRNQQKQAASLQLSDEGLAALKKQSELQGTEASDDTSQEDQIKKQIAELQKKLAEIRSKKSGTEEMQKAQDKKANMIAQQISMLNMQLVQLQKTKSQSTV